MIHPHADILEDKHLRLAKSGTGRLFAEGLSCKNILNIFHFSKYQFSLPLLSLKQIITFMSDPEIPSEMNYTPSGVSCPEQSLKDYSAFLKDTGTIKSNPWLPKGPPKLKPCAQGTLPAQIQVVSNHNAQIPPFWQG